MVGATDASVLILGESGTGKELVARAIHEAGARRERPLVRVNCASIPKELFESEFFGHVKGAFTGAIRDRLGRFEMADGGTLFLDEVGEIPPDLQAKLLRVLQEGTLERVGEERTRRVDVRIIAATNRDLLATARSGAFRLDLYYRLSVFPMELPPLRERREDIRPLAEYFLAQVKGRLGTRRLRVPVEQWARLETYDWPGNVRELQNVIERAAILARSGELSFEGLLQDGVPSGAGSAPLALPATTVEVARPASLKGLREAEREMVARALEASGGRVYGEGGAAEKLGLPPTTLTSKLRRWGWQRGGWQAGPSRRGAGEGR
jgi:transcriptional regulator with GAF, ATPase, and Fis domain